MVEGRAEKRIDIGEESCRSPESPPFPTDTANMLPHQQGKQMEAPRQLPNVLISLPGEGELI